MHSEWTDLLSAYLDGELDPVTRRRLERHLSECPACARVRTELAQIVAAAPAYQGEPPADRVWAGIVAKIDANRVVALAPARTVRRFPGRQLIAAGLIAVAAGGTAWLLARTGAPAEPEQNLTADVTLTGVTTPGSGYDAAIAELEVVLSTSRDRLDTATVRVLDESLATIDRALAEARAAIQRDSANRYLNNQIAVNLRKKVAVLQLAARAIASET